VELHTLTQVEGVDETVVAGAEVGRQIRDDLVGRLVVTEQAVEDVPGDGLVLDLEDLRRVEAADVTTNADAQRPTGNGLVGRRCVSRFRRRSGGVATPACAREQSD